MIMIIHNSVDKTFNLQLLIVVDAVGKSCWGTNVKTTNMTNLSERSKICFRPLELGQKKNVKLL